MYQHNSCSDFISDLLMFIEKKMLRMSPEKRADCKEIVGNFTELHKKSSSGPDYCTKRMNDPPLRSGTDLSELEASALKLSQAMYSSIPFHFLPEHTGPVDNDPELSRSPDAQSLSSDLGVISATNSALVTQTKHDLKGKTPEDANTISEHPTSTSSPVLGLGLFHSPHINRTTTEPSDVSNHDETDSSRPQSPSSKKVHFEKNGQNLLESSPSVNEYDVRIVRTPQGQKEQSKISQKQANEVNLYSKPMGSDVAILRAVPLTSSALAEEMRTKLFDSAESPASTRAPDQLKFAIHLSESAAADEASTGNTSVGIEGAHALPSDDVKSANLHPRNSSKPNSPEKNTHTTKDEPGFTIDAVSSILGQGQIQEQNHLTSEKSNVTGYHSQGETSGVQPPSKGLLKDLKQLFSCLCCFPGSH